MIGPADDARLQRVKEVPVDYKVQRGVHGIRLEGL